MITAVDITVFTRKLGACEWMHQKLMAHKQLARIKTSFVNCCPNYFSGTLIIYLLKFQNRIYNRPERYHMRYIYVYAYKTDNAFKSGHDWDTIYMLAVFVRLRYSIPGIKAKTQQSYCLKSSKQILKSSYNGFNFSITNYSSSNCYSGESINMQN